MQPHFDTVDRIIRYALEEDIGYGDVTSQLLIPKTVQAELAFVNREPMVNCGTQVVARAFALLDIGIRTELLVREGETVAAGTVLIRVSGPAQTILTGERVALNLYQRMCSVATLTRAYVDAMKGTKAVILDTRKTMPGLRELDKYAVRMGGGTNHRQRLDDGIMIKDNHIAVTGSIRKSLEMARNGNMKNLPIVIECDRLEQVQEAIEGGAHHIMLDNMTLAQLKEAVNWVAGRAKLEASGNVSLDTVRLIAETGVDYISVGKLTHSVRNVDIGLDKAIDIPL
jgi:nicotinate-nucleotide pyrophosphorylase (carboxylating)